MGDESQRSARQDISTVVDPLGSHHRWVLLPRKSTLRSSSHLAQFPHPLGLVGGRLLIRRRRSVSLQSFQPFPSLSFSRKVGCEFCSVKWNCSIFSHPGKKSPFIWLCIYKTRMTIHNLTPFLSPLFSSGSPCSKHTRLCVRHRGSASSSDLGLAPCGFLRRESRFHPTKQIR